MSRRTLACTSRPLVARFLKVTLRASGDTRRDAMSVHAMQEAERCARAACSLRQASNGCDASPRAVMMVLGGSFTLRPRLRWRRSAPTGSFSPAVCRAVRGRDRGGRARPLRRRRRLHGAHAGGLRADAVRAAARDRAAPVPAALALGMAAGERARRDPAELAADGARQRLVRGRPGARARARRRPPADGAGPCCSRRWPPSSACDFVASVVRERLRNGLTCGSCSARSPGFT